MFWFYLWLVRVFLGLGFKVALDHMTAGFLGVLVELCWIWFDLVVLG